MSNPNSEMEAMINPPSNLKCPRCDSEETKFCYFNNNKPSQPRYRCKNCNRFWTHGGKVRDIPSSAVERRVKRGRDSLASTISTPLTPVPSSMTSVGGDINRVGALNLTLPRPNQPRLEFIQTVINSLSIITSRAPPQHLQGQKYHVQPVFQAIYGQGIPAHHYMEPNNANIFVYNKNPVDGSTSGPSGSSSSA